MYTKSFRLVVLLSPLAALASPLAAEAQGARDMFVTGGTMSGARSDTARRGPVVRTITPVPEASTLIGFGGLFAAGGLILARRMRARS